MFPGRVGVVGQLDGWVVGDGREVWQRLVLRRRAFQNLLTSHFGSNFGNASLALRGLYGCESKTASRAFVIKVRFGLWDHALETL